MLKQQANVKEIRSFVETLYQDVGAKQDSIRSTTLEVGELASNLGTGVPFATPVFDGATEARSRTCSDWRVFRSPADHAVRRTHWEAFDRR